MIPEVQETLGTKVHFDNTLISLPVYPIEGNTTIDTIRWLQGIALANELDLKIEENFVILKGKDFARHSVVYHGKLTENFKNTASNLQWDLFEIAGVTVVEYPIAHQDLINTILSIPRSPIRFEINITLIDHQINSSKGFKLSDAIKFSVSRFDLLRYEKPYTVLNAPQLSIDRKMISYLQDNTINLSLTCQAGQPVTQRIDKQNNIITTSRDAFSQAVSQQVTSFTSGFILKLTAYPAQEYVIVEVDLELSSDTSTDDSQLPEISRKQVINTGYMKIDDIWTCASFQSKDIISNKTKSFIFPWGSNREKDETLLVTLKRTL